MCHRLVSKRRLDDDGSSRKPSFLKYFVFVSVFTHTNTVGRGLESIGWVSVKALAGSFEGF